MKKSLEDVKGIGPASALLLKKAGIGSASELAAADIDHVSSVKGFGSITAERVIESAKALLAEDAKPASEVAAPPEKKRSEAPSSSKKKHAHKKRKEKKTDKKKCKKKTAEKKDTKKKKKKKKDKKRGKKK